MTDASNMGVEAVALALANYDAAQVDAPRVDSIDAFRFDADRNDYLARARAAIAAMAVASEQEAVAYASRDQLALHEDPAPTDKYCSEAGRYLPLRKTPGGNFTMPLYVHPNPSWQPIETAPKDGWSAPILTCCMGEAPDWFGNEPVGGYAQPPSTTYWNEHGDCWTPCQRPHDVWEPTHWMPLPAAPVGQSTGEP